MNTYFSLSNHLKYSNSANIYLKIIRLSIMVFMLLGLTFQLNAITDVSDEGVNKNSVLKITVTGVTGPVTIKYGGIELTGCQTVSGTTACILFAGVVSTCPRRGWVLEVIQGGMTRTHRVTTTLGIHALAAVKSDYAIDQAQSFVVLEIPGNPTTVPLSGGFVKEDISIVSDPLQPNFGREDYILPATDFQISGIQTPAPPIIFSLQNDQPGSINLANIWNGISAGGANCLAMTSTGINQNLSLDVVHPTLGAFPINGNFVGTVDFIEGLSGGPAGNHMISGIYTGTAFTQIGEFPVQGPMTLTGTTETPDYDGDGIPDNIDNCLNGSNPTQADSDGDAVGNDCDQCPGTAADVSVGLDGCPLFAPPIPTLSQWGLILLTLLLLSIGTMAIVEKKTVMAGVGAGDEAMILTPYKKSSLFNARIYWSIFPKVQLLVPIALVSFYFIYGFITTADIFGSFISAAIIAYVFHYVLKSNELYQDEI